MSSRGRLGSPLWPEKKPLILSNAPLFLRGVVAAPVMMVPQPGLARGDSLPKPTVAADGAAYDIVDVVGVAMDEDGRGDEADADWYCRGCACDVGAAAWACEGRLAAEADAE